MRLTLATTAAAATSIVAAAQPHGHAHKHAHEVKRDWTQTETVPGPTAYVYEVEGNIIPVDKVCEGITDGEYKWADGNAPPGVCTSLSSPSTTSTAWSSTSTSTTTSSTTTSTWSSTATSASAAEFYQASSSWAAPAAATSASSGGQGLGSSFPDGQLSCSTFPSDYGAVAIDYLNMGGWTGLQSVTISGSEVTNIVTGVSGQSCSEGMMCSYACPPGYQKTQWPSTQGSTGQSVGGLSCSGGMLHLTNSALSSSLCMEGTGNVQATNNAGGVVSICRTDYPGTESETIPTVVEAGETQPLTCPDASNYYMWEGKSTSAQYYLNPPGYGASQACQWGSPGSPLGNYAPINFGVGASGGTTWLSIQANTPTTNAVYPGTVEIQGNLSGSCKYENGQYCSDSGCNSAGCTVSCLCFPSDLVWLTFLLGLCDLRHSYLCHLISSTQLWHVP
jgi:SUN family beta-glucosidase